MKFMMPVFREGSLAPLDHDYVERLLTHAPRSNAIGTYEPVSTEGYDIKSCLQKLQIGQKMLFFCSPIQAANAARNAASYGMRMCTRKSAAGGIWIGRTA